MIPKPDYCPRCQEYPLVGIEGTIQGCDWKVRCCGINGVGATRTRAVKAYNKACALFRRESTRKAKAEARRKK